MSQVLSIALHACEAVFDFFFGADPIGERVQAVRLHAEMMRMGF